MSKLNANWWIDRSAARKTIFLLVTLLALAAGQLSAVETLPLAGKWRFALDRDDVGTNQNWFSKKLPDRIQLPGILESQGYGDPISTRTPWVLSLYDHFWYLRSDYSAYTNNGSVKIPFLCQPVRHYLGAAWYQRDFDIPTNWNGRHISLFLERPHWKSTVWLDDHELGSDLSLCTPHEYELGNLPPGHHSLTIRVDNRLLLPYRLDSHSISDSLDDAWNGIVGKIELRATPPVWIEDVQIFPNLEKKSALLKIHIGNTTGVKGNGDLSAGSCFTADNDYVSMLSTPVSWDTNGAVVEMEIPLKNPEKTWDEFHPNLRALFIQLHGGFGDDINITWQFGLRDFHANGNALELNGHPLYLRGTHFGGDFPLTGYPPTDVESWKKIFLTCKAWGLNHMRFHSWCPPEAAFEAADETGIYLQVECGMWNTFSPGSPLEKMLYSETERIIRAYGNHPSLMLISASNEAGGRWKQVLPDWVKHFRVEDPRHLYTPDTGWSLIDSPGEPINGGADYLAIGRVGPARIRGESGWFGRDYGDSIAGVTVPVISHEVGQWVAYPDFDVIKEFTGFMRPGNFEIFRASAEQHHLFARHENPVRPTNHDFAYASGRFQLQCYKEEVEANLRTPGLSGFQLLDLHDYTGQGTALVGLLDPLWHTKGYATSNEFSQFCAPVVPLARLPQRIFSSTDTVEIPLEAANFSSHVLTNALVAWSVRDMSGKIIIGNYMGQTNVPMGKGIQLGRVSIDLSQLTAPGEYQVGFSLQPQPLQRHAFYQNSWNIWIYPAQFTNAPADDVLITSDWDAASKKLSAGGKVLFQPRTADLDWSSPPLAAVPVFWNALMGPTWSRMLGLWCNTNHPALAEFPTEPNCDWQWTELVRNARAINLDKLPHGLNPIVSAIDDWNRTYKLGVIFEAKVARGRLLVCSINLDSRPGAQQLRHSLLDYMAGKNFLPKTSLSLSEFNSLHFDTRIMHHLGATAAADGHNAREIIDGDPNTFWSSADARGNGPAHPHVFEIHFPSPVALNGLLIMPRQNQREHQGDIAEYQVESSVDGTNWQPVVKGDLASTFDPQKIRFPKIISTAHLRLTVLSGFGTDHSSALAEIAVMYAGPKLAADDSGDIEYQHIRTASPDIDAGDGSGQRKK